MKKQVNEKSQKKVIVWVTSVLAAVIIVCLALFIAALKPVRYGLAVKNIEADNLKKGYDTLIGIAEKDADYKNTSELLYTRSIELIETGVLENKQEAYKMLTPISGYKYADEIMYYLWVEDVYDPDDYNTFEQAQGFIEMIPSDYDGPFATEVESFRSDIEESVNWLNKQKYEAATSDSFE